MRSQFRLFVAACAVLCAVDVSAQEAGSSSPPPLPPANLANPAAETPPTFRETAPGVFVLGGVTLRKAERTVSFPVEINQRSNLVEYVVVHNSGKTHESVFRTGADPLHIHLAMLLLGVKSANVSNLGGSPKTPVPGQPVRIEARWRESGKEVLRPLEDLIVYTTNQLQTLPTATWTYNGSHVKSKRFAASDDGSIISLQEDAAALINNPLPSRFFDDLHLVNRKALPPEETPLELIISPAPEPAK